MPFEGAPIDRSRAGAWAAYASFYGRALSSHLEYAMAVWINLLAMAGGFAFTIMVWHYAYPAGPEAPRFFAYLTLAFALNFTLSMAFERYVGERIREGLIATDLLKPVDYTWLFFFQAASDVTFQAIFALAVVLAALPFFGAALAPASMMALGLAGVSVLLALWVQFHLGFAFVQMIFATNSNYGPFTLRMLCHTAFAGLFAPLDIYPPLFQHIAMSLPFRHVIYTPIAIYQGRIVGDDVWWALGSQVLWGAILFAGSRISFSIIRRYLTIQGG